MSTSPTLRTLVGIALSVLLLPELIAAQIPVIGREHTTLTRLRPADVHLANQTIMVQVTPVDARAAGMTERLKKLVTNRMIGVNKNLREVNKTPYYLVDCSITRYEYNERSEKKKLLLVKDQGMFKIITASLEASYNVVRTSGNVTLFGGNIPGAYKKEFQEGVESAPVKAEVEDFLIRSVVASILEKLTNTPEKLEVRLMGQSGLSRFARLAEASQWAEYIESIKALPEQKVDKDSKSGFEGDRHHNLAVAYEARFYETMWKDYQRAQQYFELADSAIRKARQYDPREREYMKAQVRLGQGKEFFETIKERFPKDSEIQKPEGPDKPGPDQIPIGGPAASGAMTNKEVIEMVTKGVSERFILEQISEAKIKQFDVSSRGIIQLTTAGVSDQIIDAVKRAMRRQPPAQRRKPKQPRQSPLNY